MIVYNTMEEVKQFLATLKIFDKTCISYPDLLRKRKGTKISFEKKLNCTLNAYLF